MSCSNCSNCGTCFKICQPFQACFGEMVVKVPVSYVPTDIIVSISNGQKINYRQACEITDGSVTIDLTLFPDGFFSAYGGPYKLQFLDVQTAEIISFVATDGNNYTCIEFDFQNGSEVDSITISAFG